MTKARRINEVDAIWDGRELDFAMSIDGLSELKSCFREFAYGTYHLAHSSIVSDSAVTMMEIRHGEEKLRVSLEPGKVVFTGNKKAMLLLADNMETLLNLWAAGGKQHFHFDPSSNQLLLEPDSEAFILSPRRVSGQ